MRRRLRTNFVSPLFPSCITPSHCLCCIIMYLHYICTRTGSVTLLRDLICDRSAIERPRFPKRALEFCLKIRHSSTDDEHILFKWQSLCRVTVRFFVYRRYLNVILIRRTCLRDHSHNRALS